MTMQFIENASPEELKKAFPTSPTFSEQEREAALNTVYAAKREQNDQIEYLNKLEYALVLAGNDGPEIRRALLDNIETCFLINETEEILSRSKLGTAIGHMEKLLENEQTDLPRLEQLHSKLNCITGYIDQILHHMENMPKECEESMHYYGKVRERGRALSAKISNYRTLLGEAPEKPKVPQEPLSRLHETSVFDLYKMLQAGEAKKKIRELRAAAEQESALNKTSDVDLCDKRLLLGATMDSQAKTTLEAVKWVQDSKTGGRRKRSVVNSLSVEAAYLEVELPRLKENAEKMKDSQAKPSRFWRALLAMLLCAAVAYLSYRQPADMTAFFNDGYRLFYVVFGLAFVAGLLAKGILFGILLCFCSGFAAVNATILGNIFIRGELTIEEIIFLTLGVGMAFCALILLWRTIASLRTLGNSGSSQKTVLTKLRELEQRADVGAGCTEMLMDAAKAQDANGAAERYRALNARFRNVRKTAQNYLD